jgi:uncharacterized protein YrrD
MEQVTMDIELGKPVYTQDGEHVGDVERLIIDTEGNVVREFLIKEGTLLSTDRIVNVDLVTRIDEDGVHISIPKDSVEDLPAFVKDHYVTPAEHELNEMPQAWIGPAGGAGGGGPLITGPVSPDRHEPGGGSLFEPATVPAGAEAPESPVDDTGVVIDEGTDVIDRDGEHIGSVEEVHFGGDGHISGFTVKTGTIFTNELSIPLKWVDSLQPDGVRLTVSGEEAEKSGKVDD